MHCKNNIKNKLQTYHHRLELQLLHLDLSLDRCLPYAVLSLCWTNGRI